MSVPRDEGNVPDEVFFPPYPTSTQKVGTQRSKQMPPHCSLSPSLWRGLFLLLLFLHSTCFIYQNIHLYTQGKKEKKNQATLPSLPSPINSFLWVSYALSHLCSSFRQPCPSPRCQQCSAEVPLTFSCAEEFIDKQSYTLGKNAVGTVVHSPKRHLNNWRF